mgnify:FL=1
MIRTTALGLGLLGAFAHAWASPITLDTTWLDANGRLSLSADARQTLAVTGIDMGVGGKAVEVADGVFNLPISQISADIKLLPPALTMRSAQVKGSSLDFHNTLNQSSVSLADLSMDFSTHIVSGNVVGANGTTRSSLFSFDVTAPLSFSFKGGISVNLALGHLHFTDAGAASFASALGVPDFLAPVLKQVDFGVIDAKVVPWLRQPVSSNVAMASTMMQAAVVSVPEPSSGWLGVLGLALMGLVRARRLVEPGDGR